MEKHIKTPIFIKTVLILLLSFGIAYLITFVLKEIVSRPRYRIAFDQETLQLNWWNKLESVDSYIALGIPKEQFKSFPSGHSTTSVISLILCVYLPYIFKNKNNKELLCFVIAYSYVVIMAFSRMLCGAHYLSDVSCGILISSLFLVISNEIWLKNYKNLSKE
jgi:membrane-associated phospholipid phosphatase